MRFLLLALVALPASAQTRHPDPKYIVPAPRTVTIALSGTPARPAFGPTSTLVGTIGTEAGPAPTIFGEVRSARFLDDSTVVVLDGTVPEVRLFSVTGRHRHTVGRSGSGPGEFRFPHAAVRSPSGELLVADVQRTVQIFRLGPRGFEHHRTWTLPFAPSAMCYLGDRLFVNATTIPHRGMIHELGPDGTVRASFGSIYRSPNQSVNTQLGTGFLVCDASAGMIYFMPSGTIGEVRAFRPTGELVWCVEVSPFLTRIITDNEDGGIDVYPNPRGQHRGRSLALVPGMGLLAMWSETTPAQVKAGEEGMLTHLVRIDPATGQATQIGTVPALVLDVRGTRRLELLEDPYPRVEVRAR